MEEAEPQTFPDTFIAILKELQLIKKMQENVANYSDPSPNNDNKTSQEMDTLLTNIEAEFYGTTREALPISPGFRRRSRKQNKEDISRIDVVKAEEEEILEELKKEQCRGFLESFCAVLPDFTPSDAFFRERADLGHNLEVCKRLAGRVGRFMREKAVELERETAEVERLEEEVRREREVTEELMKEVVALDRKLDIVVAAASKGSKTDCSYCSVILGELGEQKSQILSDIALKFRKTDDLVSSDVVAFADAKLVRESITSSGHVPEGFLFSNCLELCEAVSLKPLQMQLDAVCEEIEFTGIRTNSKLDGAPKVNQMSHNNICMDSMNGPVFTECHQPGNVTKVNVQSEIKDSVETTKLDGKEINVKLTDDNVEVENGCKLGNGDGNQEENRAAESKDYRRLIFKENARESIGSDGYSEETGYDDNYLKLNYLLELENEYDIIEIKCGCTSLKNVDTVGTLRINKSGLFEIYCECMEGCNGGKPMSPVAFKTHAGHGANRKWTNSIWILMKHKKVQLSKVEILEPYCQKYKEIQNMEKSNLENISNSSHADTSNHGMEVNEKPRLRPRKRDNSNNAVGNGKQKRSKLRYHRWYCKCNFCGN
ncbi:hypothetical protein SUGI_1115980 [Cryptomeria japonica]|uniref:uncharacterized protein LOC131031359 isoform X2 n=1 Tax=Cryptomeria japonica TaxID=3369 RepID=UPI002414ADDC|nr:uncharacterized protein LOC131031359 isoform X2 [Cryptomeria japonica]GLJ52464.1 hypothetical protein SUGI_1115980 [Cryptomeria japonica]